MQKLKIKNQNYKSKIKNFGFYIVILIFAFCILNFIGCATVPMREALPTYNIGGVTYVPLLSLCASQNIAWEYDSFTRKVNLAKDAHKINLMVGEKLVLVDGLQQYLRYPVDIYQGTVVVPYKFKEQILDTLFKKVYPRGKIPLSRIKKVVIDAGHGGTDPGSIGKSGLREKYVNLDITKRLSTLLKSQGLDVVLTRSTDTFVPLERRAEIANNSKADLFISIHSNANRVRSLKGFEVYYVSPTVSDSKRALYSAQHEVLGLDRNCFSSAPSSNLKAILWDMIYTSNRAEALRLCQYVCRAIDSSLNTRVLGVKGGPFYVLKAVHMPAVLIEVGYLSNYNEERLMRNNYYRQQIAEGIGEGLRNYIRDSAPIEVARQ